MHRFWCARCRNLDADHHHRSIHFMNPDPDLIKATRLDFSLDLVKKQPEFARTQLCLENSKTQNTWKLLLHSFLAHHWFFFCRRLGLRE
ncbi:hypothetical protein ACOSP7_032834 [Xanthoceras sorbifolium]